MKRRDIWKKSAPKASSIALTDVKELDLDEPDRGSSIESLELDLDRYFCVSDVLSGDGALPGLRA